MAKNSSTDSSQSDDEAAVKLWFRITMACTFIFVSAVFLFII